MPVPDIPRETWIEHPHYGTQTLLLGSHDAFRRRSDWMIERIEDLDPGDDADTRRRKRWLARSSTEFDWWMAGMKGHERYEENKLYRFLVRRYDVEVDALEEGHRVLNEHKRRVQDGYRHSMSAAADPGASIRALLTAMREHRTILRDHLRDEEDMVIPMLLALTPAEFRQYYNTPIDRLLATMD
jgi:hypothetical protein